MLEIVADQKKHCSTVLPHTRKSLQPSFEAFKSDNDFMFGGVTFVIPKRITSPVYYPAGDTGSLRLRLRIAQLASLAQRAITDRSLDIQLTS